MEEAIVARRGLAPLVIVVTLISGCTSTATAPPSPEQRPADQWSAVLRATSFTAQSSSSDSPAVITTTADPLRRLCDSTVAPASTDPADSIRFIGGDAYVSQDANHESWYHFDRRRFTDDNGLVLRCGLMDVLVVLAGVTASDQVSAGHYQGTADLSEAIVRSTTATLSHRATRMAQDYQSGVPFKAVVDSQARLSSLTFVLTTSSPTPQDYAFTYTFSQYGERVTVQPPPASQTQEATNAMYQLLLS
jgi:hypothetical protein